MFFCRITARESFWEIMKSNLSDVTLDVEGKFGKKDSERRINTCFHHVGYLVVALGGVLTGIMYFARLSLSITMLSMVNRTHLYMVEHPNYTIEELELKVNREEDGEFNWSNELQQMIIGSYMITYTLPQILAGHLCARYGFRLSALIGLLLVGFSCLSAPFLVYKDWKWALVLRMLQGLGASGTVSYIIMAIETWLPEHLAPMGLSIMQVAETSIVFVSPLVTGILSAIHWQWGFYAPGLAGVLIALVWFLFARDQPQKCSFVSQLELDRLEENKKNMSEKETNNGEKNLAAELPWYFMFKIKNFYLLTVVWTCHCVADGSVIYLAPTYFRKAFQLSTKDNGLYNFIIQAGILFSAIWPTPLITLLQNQFKLSLTASRQVIVLIYCSICTSTTMYIAIYHDQQILMLGLYRLFHSTNQLILTATIMSQYGKYGLSGPIFSTANTIGMLFQALFCWAIGRMLDYSGETYASWSYTFGFIALFNALIFLIYLGALKSEPVRIRQLTCSDRVTEDKKATV